MQKEPKVDAEYMNRWLGDDSKVESLSPKTLFDVQSLIEYYRDIIVPGSKVTISFPVEGSHSSPRASVDKNEIFIPYHMLKEGRVDETIGAMIHELHHIKLSPSERFIQSVSFKFLKDLMGVIDCNGLTLAERVFSNGNIDFKTVFSDETNTAGIDNDVLFLRQVVGDLLFLLNAAEDVRIDANTTSNLRKYIDKVDKNASASLRELKKSGDLIPEELSALSFLLLGHHKGIFHSDVIHSRFGNREDIVDADPLELPSKLFNEFAPEIAEHVLETYYKYCGEPKASSSGDDMDVESYFIDKVQGAVSNSLEEGLQELPKPEGQSEADFKSEEEALKDYSDSLNLDKQDGSIQSALEKAKERQAREENGEESSDYAKASKAAKGNIETTEAQKHRVKVENKKNEVFIDSYLLTKVKSFKDVQVFTTTEHFTNYDELKTVVFDSVIFDTVN